MHKISLSLFLLLIHFSLSAQVIEFDQLEMRYNQKHYRSVYRKSVKLLDDPAYDFSYIPRYYLALSKLQLAQNKGWNRRHKYAIDDAIETFKELSNNYDGQEVLRAHQYELSTLKNDLNLWMYNLKLDGDQKKFDQLKDFIDHVLPQVPEVSDMREDRVLPKIGNDEEGEEVDDQENEDVSPSFKLPITEERKEIVQFSTSLLGIPYKWAGTTPKGFDCSGFTCYVSKNVLNQVIPRRAAVQFEDSKRVKRKNVHPGDFVFFKNGTKISHVGIVFSTENNSVQMIHASSSVGISVVDIYQSTYWKKRIAGFGTFLED